MKISKAKLRQIIKEELGTLREQDPAEENYVKLVNALGDIFQHHLEEVGMERAEILRAVEEATEIELAGNDEEETIRDDGAPPEIGSEADQAWWADKLNQGLRDLK